MYILDQVRALENEMILRIRKQGLDVTPRILIVSVSVHSFIFLCFMYYGVSDLNVILFFFF